MVDGGAGGTERSPGEVGLDRGDEQVQQQAEYHFKGGGVCLVLL